MGERDQGHPALSPLFLLFPFLFFDFEKLKIEINDDFLPIPYHPILFPSN